MHISCHLKTSLKIHEKKKENHFKKITVSCQFSVRKIGNFGTDQLKHGKDTLVSFMRVNYRHQHSHSHFNLAFGGIDHF